MGFELTPAFWSGLGQIILVNIVLSGDNALVIALACRNLEKRYQKPAILAGSAGAIVLRIIFVLIVDQLLKIGYLKLIGGLLLLWIGVKLVQGEEEHGDGVKAAGSLWSAIRTIIIADAVMSLDNAIAIAAAAKGDTVLIVVGLLISIPLIIFGATLIMILLNRFPIIVIAGGGLLGYIAGEVIATDPAYAEQARGDAAARQDVLRDRRRGADRRHWLLAAAARQGEEARGAGRPRRRRTQGVAAMAKMKAILVPVDGSDTSDRAVRHACDLLDAGLAAELHLLNVQPNLGGAISTFVSKDQIDTHHREEGQKGLATAIEITKKAGVAAKIHIGVGRQGEVVDDFVAKLGAGLVVIGTRGHTGLAGVLLGSVAQDVIAHVKVPVTLVK